MTGNPSEITGAASLVRALERVRIDTVFGLVGHGNLAFVDALQDSDTIDYVTVFHEQVAAHAADAYFRASGRIAVVTTTVGPGFTNLMTGLGDAMLDSSALVVIAGGMPSAYVGKEPLQELSYSIDNAQLDIARPLTKRIMLATGAAELANQFHRAVRYALTGCPGPVVLQVPLDFFSDWVDPSVATLRPTRPGRSGPDSAEVGRAADLIARAERPLVFAGGGAIISRASTALTRLADGFGMPVATTMSGQGAISEDHPLSIGYTGVVGTRPGNNAARRADLLLAVGTRFPEMDCNNWRPDYFTPIPPSRLIHIDIDPNQIGKIYPTDVALVGDARRSLEDLAAALESRLDGGDRWGDWHAELAHEKQTWADDLHDVRTTPSFPYEPAYLGTVLRGLLPPETILITGVGIRHAIGQHYPFLNEGTQVVASGFGTMGQEVAAPIGVRLARRDVPVVGLVGDGAVMACLAALPTAVAANIDVVWLIANNTGYASIALYQTKHYGRDAGTYFKDSEGVTYDLDYVAFARSFGARAERVTDPADFPGLLATALEERGTWVLELPVTPYPRIIGSGHWDVNDILAAGTERGRRA
ncbi:MAG: thiamine pyrophosphate-binding protein [bacterium]|nr:thiamine pyrophosphate-binding protein [bacterium]